MGTRSILSILLITILLIGTISFDATFADKDDDKEDKSPKTFESECAKKLDKKKLNLDGFFCQVIIALQTAVASLDARVTELEENGVSEQGEQGEPGIAGTSLSCDNQHAIATSIPTFMIEPQCLLPLSVEVDDLTYPSVFLGGGISYTCNTNIPVTISGGQQAPFNFSWELISLNPTASIFQINGMPAIVQWAIGVSTPPNPSVAELELTVSEGGGTVLVIPVTLSCVTLSVPAPPT